MPTRSRTRTYGESKPILFQPPLFAVSCVAVLAEWPVAPFFGYWHGRRPHLRHYTGQFFRRIRQARDAMRPGEGGLTLHLSKCAIVHNTDFRDAAV
eukprot:3392101-Amphidinium_carterae.1